LGLLRFGICGLAFDSEKQWPGPPRAGNQAGNLRETLVAGAVVLVPVGFDTHQVNPIAPLANQSCSGGVIDICIPALMQRACRHSHPSDQAGAADVFLRQEPEDEDDEDEGDGDRKEDDDGYEEENDGYSELFGLPSETL
jgi:hypothetical protein